MQAKSAKKHAGQVTMVMLTSYRTYLLACAAVNK